MREIKKRKKKDFKCRFCEKGLSAKFNLRDHMKKVHLYQVRNHNIKQKFKDKAGMYPVSNFE